MVGITYPLGCGLDAEEVSKTTGVNYDFVIRPDNTIAVAYYSTGPIGRFVAKDVFNLVKFYKSRR